MQAIVATHLEQVAVQARLDVALGYHLSSAPRAERGPRSA
jgi:hypothetical protein